MEVVAARSVALYRLIVRPLAAEPVRALLTVAAVALGVAVIVAVDLASEASMGSFRSSLESLQGSARYEITQVGGIPEAAYGELARLEPPLAFSPRIESFALVPATGEQVPLFGVDLVGDARFRGPGALRRSDPGALRRSDPGALRRSAPGAPRRSDPDALRRSDLRGPIGESSVWVSASLGVTPGETLELVVGDRRLKLDVQGVLDASVAAGRFAVMDIAPAQRALGRIGWLDRIYVYVQDDWPGRDRGRGAGDAQDWPMVLAPHLPPAASILPAGTGTEDSRRMLGAFRWNLRMMSYATILVGAFLIYNTVSAWIVRRRPQIGIVRAVGASRTMVRAAFLFEGLVFGALGVAAGLVLGRLLAIGALDAVGQTVSALYVSSTPGEIAFRPWTVGVALVAGVGVSVLSAWWPAREAAGVTPTEAMTPASLDYRVHAANPRLTAVAVGLAALAVVCSAVPPVDRMPVGGYAALICLIGAAALISPRMSTAVLALCDRWLATRFGAIPRLAARGLAASLGRTSVMVTAMAVATALIVGMAVMVGSFRETVVVWVEHRLQADFYVSPVGGGGRGAPATMHENVVERVESVPGVLDVGRYRTYPIRHAGLPATLGLADVALYRRHSGIEFLDGPAPEAIWPQLAAGDGVIVSELFSDRHGVGTGDMLRLPLGAEALELRVAGVFYDYSGDRGFVIGDRRALLPHLPDRRLSSLGIYLAPGADPERSREALVRALAGPEVVVTPSRTLRERSIEIFDRTFAITWALEAIAILVAILGMAEALLNLVFDRRVELAQLRMQGASRGQIRALVLVQAGLLGAAACGLGLVLGVAWSQVNLLVIHRQSFGWSVQLDWPVAFLAGALGLVLAASVASGLYPARMAARLNPVEVLRGE